MKHLRYLVPVFGIVALFALLLKMPEIPFFKCKTCAAGNPYLPLIGSGYFSLLIALSLLFPTFPSPLVARSGLFWAVLLAFSLTYSDFPKWCIICLIAHACHILIWAIWWVIPSETEEPSSPFKERLCLTLFAPICMAALFSSLNLTFLVYNLKAKQPAGLKPGDAVPSFAVQGPVDRTFTHTDSVATVINFVTPHCSYCKEQLPIVETAAKLLTSYRFITISPSLTPELLQQSPSSEWFEDKEGQMRKSFKVAGYPTLFIVGSDGKIQKVIPGVPQGLMTLIVDKS